MKKGLLLTLFCLGMAFLTARGNSIANGDSLQYLYKLACKNYNYSSAIPEENILKLCQKMEALARSQKDYESLFFVQQITVNSYCLKGDIGLAVNKAQQMYEDAKELKLSVGLALSIQAMADTYMHSNQYKQALETFKEAWDILKGGDNNLLKVRLLLQQVHVCMLMEDATEMQSYLIEASKLLDRSNIPNIDDYAFYLQCYQTFYNIAIADSELAQRSLYEVQQMKTDDVLFNRWYYFLQCRYYELTKDYAKALLYCDSTQQVVKRGHNLNEYKQLMLVQASLMIKNGEKESACELYNQARKLSDSLNMVRYSMQIDSLHVTYWVDQMELENVVVYNRLLKWSLACGLLVLFIIALLIYLGIKENRKLIDSKKKLEMIRQETAESIHSKSLFLSNMSHELRTPLNAIVGFADLLAQEIVEDAESKQLFGDRIKQNADLLLKLFNDVADLSALKDKNIQFVFKDCDGVALCRNVVDTVDNVKRTNAEVRFVTALETLELYTDPERLQQVLINLLINATKFTEEGSITLLLEVNEQENEAVFTIKDTGCGIPLKKQPHIFERFEKLHEGVQGAGLGLSICQLIVEHIGGKIWIDASYTEGACFVFTHPLKHTT